MHCNVTDSDQEFFLEKWKLIRTGCLLRIDRLHLHGTGLHHSAGSKADAPDHIGLAVSTSIKPMIIDSRTYRLLNSEVSDSHEPSVKHEHCHVVLHICFKHVRNYTTPATAGRPAVSNGANLRTGTTNPTLIPGTMDDNHRRQISSDTYDICRRDRSINGLHCSRFHGGARQGDNNENASTLIISAVC